MQELDRLMKPDPVQQAEKLARYERLANSNEGAANESRRHQLQWNPGKTTLVDNLLAPRMRAPKFEVETINAGSTDSGAERLKGKDYGGLQEDLMTLDSAIVDVGASNVEEFIKQMGQFDGSHEEFDFFLVPAVSEKKQQADTVSTIETLAGLGVPPKKIRIVFNKVELEDANDVPRLFGTIFGSTRQPVLHLAAGCRGVQERDF